VEALGLTPEGYMDSIALKRWVIENKDRKYVPTELLNAWGFVIKSEAEQGSSNIRANQTWRVSISRIKRFGL
jgi:hypothetical protein